jgi:acyl-CoA reductase-like NAD-dependent aldehyde dehydrogenase
MLERYINGKCVEGAGKSFDVVTPIMEESIATIKAADEVQTAAVRLQESLTSVKNS